MRMNWLRGATWRIYRLLSSNRAYSTDIVVAPEVMWGGLFRTELDLAGPALWVWSLGKWVAWHWAASASQVRGLDFWAYRLGGESELFTRASIGPHSWFPSETRTWEQ